jgi:hypothetical protein
MRHFFAVRRPTALVALMLFLLGNNFCLLAAPIAGACPNRSGHPTGMAQARPMHACCVAAAARKARNDDATREATAPCCVAISATVAPPATVLEAAPSQATLVLPLTLYSTGAVDFARIVPVEVSPSPPPRAATPDAGRAPPRR